MRNARIKHQAGCDSKGALYTEKPTFINSKAPMKRTEKPHLHQVVFNLE